MVSMTYSTKNVKYWKINHKNTCLRLKVLIGSKYSVSNGLQILAQCSKIVKHSPMFGAVTVLITF